MYFMDAFTTLSLYAADVDEQLMRIAMHIQSDLVYDKHSGKCKQTCILLIVNLCRTVLFQLNVHGQCVLISNVIFFKGAMIGFAIIGDINSHLHAFEHSLEEKKEE